MTFSIHIIDLRYVFDNYAYVLRDEQADVTAVIDPAEADGVLKWLDAKKWKLDYILNTHHHWDHTDGNAGIKRATGCKVAGFDGDASRIPEIDIKLQANESFAIGGYSAKVLHVPGHTSGHVAYYIKSEKAVFTGDAMFCMGCGRVFEGTPEQMLHSLNVIASLPEDTQCYCGHEYTQNNGAFALSVEPDNAQLSARMQQVKILRDNEQPTVPASIGLEKRTNPFLRTHSAAIRTHLNMPDASDVDVFAELRLRKNSF